MKVLMIARSTLFTTRGGDTVQVCETAKKLRLMGVEVDICTTDAVSTYEGYNLLHFFNIIRPADIIKHIKASHKPFVVSTIFVDYSEYDRNLRTGISGWLFRLLNADAIEYCKTIARWIVGRDRLMSSSYLWRGQKNSIRYILKHAAMVLPNSYSEYKRLCERYDCSTPFHIVPNGIDTKLFRKKVTVQREADLVLCVARIEGIKNQLNLIRALKGTRFRLWLIGSASPSQRQYYETCKREAGPDVVFIEHVPQTELLQYYSRAAVHVLPSWFETTGLSSLEAAAMGCAVVISNRGDAAEYFGENVLYCDPASPDSIRMAVEKAAASSLSIAENLSERYNWQEAAKATAAAYRSINSHS